MHIGPYKVVIVHDDNFDEFGPPSFNVLSDLDAGPTVSDEIRRIWDSEVLADSDGDEFSDLMRLLDSDLLPDYDPDDDDDYRPEDSYGTDDDLEVTLDGCPFDIDELLDNVH